MCEDARRVMFVFEPLTKSVVPAALAPPTEIVSPVAAATVSFTPLRLRFEPAPIVTASLDPVSDTFEFSRSATALFDAVSDRATPAAPLPPMVYLGGRSGVTT